MFVRLKFAIRLIFLTMFTVLCSVGAANAQLQGEVTGGDFFTAGKGKVGSIDGGPWSPDTATYTIRNPGVLPMFWSIRENINGMSLLKKEGGVTSTVSSLEGILLPFDSKTITLVVDPNADQMAPGAVRTGRLTGQAGNKIFLFSLQITATGAPEIDVSASEVFEAVGPVKGPFAPVSRTYEISNPGLLPVQWIATENIEGMQVSPNLGTLQPGAVTTVRVRVDNQARTLPANDNRFGLVTFTNMTNGRGNTTRRLRLRTTSEARMEIASNERYSVSGREGVGPFNRPFKIYSVSNIGAETLKYKLSSDIKGFNFSNGDVVTSGTVPAGGSRNIRISVNDEAKTVNSISPRVGDLSFVNVTNGLGDTSRELRITAFKAGKLLISEPGGFSSTGVEGGPFRPSRKTFTLKNTSGGPIQFSIGENHRYMSTSYSGGVLEAGETRVFYVYLVNNPESLPEGSTYTGELTVTDFSNFERITKPLTLTIDFPPKAANDDLDDAKEILGLVGSDISEANTLYSMENRELNHSAEGNTENGRSAWWKWTAPFTGQMQFNSFSSIGDTVISAYVYFEGGEPRVDQITQIASNNDADSGFDGQIFFHAIEGQTYYLAIAARNKIERLEGTYTLRWSNPQGATPGLAASVLPSARSIKRGDTVTAFATVINTSNINARDCSISFPSQYAGGTLFQFQTTNSSNAVTGRVNTPVDINAGQSRGFVFAISNHKNEDYEDNFNLYDGAEIELVFDCANMAPATTIAGLNTFFLSVDPDQPADMLAIANTASGDGIVDIPGNTGTGFFAAAAINNNGPETTITASVDTGATNLPVNFTLCQTDAGGTCLVPPAPTVTFNAQTNAAYTFSVFATGTGNVAFDPANNRAFLRFKEGSIIRGATSVAIRTQ